MNEVNTKQVYLEIKDLSFKSEQLVVDLLRFLSETLPQIKIERNGFEVDITAPNKLSKRAIKLRLKKFLYKKGLNNDYRPISVKDVDKDGFMIKEKKMVELSYY
jgi:hypothetical protein